MSNKMPHNVRVMRDAISRAIAQQDYTEVSRLCRMMLEVLRDNAFLERPGNV